MKPIIIVIMAAATLIPILQHRTIATVKKVKKAIAPAKKTEDKKGNDMFFHDVNVKYRIF